MKITRKYMEFAKILFIRLKQWFSDLIDTDLDVIWFIRLISKILIIKQFQMRQTNWSKVEIIENPSILKMWYFYLSTTPRYVAR